MIRMTDKVSSPFLKNKGNAEIGNGVATTDKMAA